MARERIDLSADEISEVAALHCESIRLGFISSLGPAFVRTLYRAIARAPGACVLVRSGAGGAVAGFVAGAVSTQRMFHWILPRYGSLLFLRILLRIWSPKAIKQAMETVAYVGRGPTTDSTSETAPTESGAELLAIAVSADCRNQGIGKGLVADFEDFLRTQSCDRYKVVTYAEDSSSNGFYLRAGFSHRRSFQHHGRLMNEYVKRVEI